MNRKMALRRVHMRRIYADWTNVVGLSAWGFREAKKICRAEDARIVAALLTEFGLEMKDG
jgi:lysophospholipid acyltransferase (LPLAT)-like uncharacterized protein